MAVGRRFLKRAVLLWALSAPAAGFAQDVQLDIAGDDATQELLRPVLRAASLSWALRQQDDAVPQDFVAAARADYRALLTGLYSEGFYAGTISVRVDGIEASRIAPLDAPAAIGEVRLTVDPGPRFQFGEALVAPVPDGAVLPDGFATGAPARSGAIGDAVRAAISAWRDAGHATAEPSSQRITAQHSQSRLNASVTLSPGPRLTFGPLTVSGAEAVRADRIADIAGLPEGDVFSPAELDAAANRLRRTGAFASVAMVERAPTGTTLPIEVQVDEQTPRRIGFGAEVSTVEGLALSAFWLHRNLLGGAERFRIEGEVTGIGGATGGTDYALGFTFNRPASLGPLTDFVASGRVERVDDPGYFIDQVSLDVGFSRRVNDTLSYEIGLGFLSAEVEDDLGARSYTFLTAPLSLDWDRRDDTLNPSGGTFLVAELTPFVSIEGDAAGARIFADGRAYRSLGADQRLTLAARGQLGAVLGVEAAEAPADFLFFSGGGGTVRGQSYQSLGVDTGGGGTIGGRGFLGAQLEARYAITDAIGAVAFYDAGLIGPDAFSGDGADWHAGVGLGVRYQTGIGPIRLDVAVPATGDGINGGDVQVYIGIGQAF